MLDSESSRRRTAAGYTLARVLSLFAVSAKVIDKVAALSGTLPPYKKFVKDPLNENAVHLPVG